MVLIDVRLPMDTDVGAPLFANDAVLVGVGPGLQLVSVFQSELVAPVHVPSTATAGATPRQVLPMSTPAPTLRSRRAAKPNRSAASVADSCHRRRKCSATLPRPRQRDVSRRCPS